MTSVAQAPASPSHKTMRSSSPSSSSSGAASAAAAATTATTTTAVASSNNSPLKRVIPQSSTDAVTVVPSASNCSYSPCFCEENIWQLCEHVRRHQQSDTNELANCFAVFVSNQKQVVPLWRQKAGKDEEKLVIWDYHAIMLYRPDERRCLVYDLDSDLPFPTHFHKYVTETFRTDAILNQEYHRIFRVVPAALFLQKFASDRRHMKKADGSWMKPPPAYPCIQTEEAVHNLDDFISMDREKEGFGEVVSLTEFVQRFYKK